MHSKSDETFKIVTGDPVSPLKQFILTYELGVRNPDK
jgi:hypothetical protein